jgi:hypothetical protein
VINNQLQIRQSPLKGTVIMSSITDLTRSISTSNNGLAPQQSEMLQQAKSAGVDDKQLAMMELQAKMDNMKTMNDLFSNLIKKMGEMSDKIVNNI